jgi:VanZ family protein
VAFYLMIKKLNIQLYNWIPALLVMSVIFWFSSQPSSNLPNFDWADKVIKKGGHMCGYALLAWSYWRALHFQPNNRRLAWLLAILYAITDEYHQSFVTGRFPSATDVFVFDNLGALLSLWITNINHKTKTTSPTCA